MDARETRGFAHAGVRGAKAHSLVWDNAHRYRSDRESKADRADFLRFFVACFRRRRRQSVEPHADACIAANPGNVPDDSVRWPGPATHATDHLRGCRHQRRGDHHRIAPCALAGPGRPSSHSRILASHGAADRRDRAYLSSGGARLCFDGDRRIYSRIDAGERGRAAAHADGATQDVARGLCPACRRVMLLIQTALATMLLVLGVATVSQWWRVAHIDPGFEAVGASSVEISPDARQFPAIEDVRRIADTIRAATLHLPGVDATGVSTMLPVGSAFFMPFRLASNKKSSLQYGMVSPGAMESMGMTLLAGRTIREGDGATAPAVAIVNQAYLDRVDGHGLGGWVRPAWRLGANRPMRIIGVVADTRSAGADRAAEPTVFVPLAQVDGSVFDFIRRFVPTYVIVRGPGGATIDDQALRKLVHAVAPGLATGPAQSFRHLARQATGQVRRNAAVAALFAGMALSLACIGLYAVQSLEVTDRRREISLRDALGATPMDLVGNLLSRGVGMATPGVALGLVAAVALDRGFAHPALETGELDAGVTAAAALLMTFAALCAVALPSLRASVARTTCLLYGGLAPSPHGQR